MTINQLFNQNNKEKIMHAINHSLHSQPLKIICNKPLARTN